MFTYPISNSGGGVFSINDPTDIAELWMWMDSVDTSTLWQTSTGYLNKSNPVTAAGQNVSYWEDKSGGANDWYNASATTSPLYTESFNTDKPALDFIPARGFGLQCNRVKATTNWTFFWVLNNRAATGGADTYLMDWQTGRMIFYRTSAGTSYYGNTTANSGTPHVTTSPSILTYVIDDTDATSSSISVNQVLCASFATTTESQQGNQVMGNTYNLSGSFEWDGNIASMIAYAGALSAEEIFAVETYLAARYGVSL